MNVADPMLPASSVAVQVTVVVAIGNVDPEAGVQTGVIGPSTASSAEAEKLTGAPAGLTALTVMLAGTVTTGAVVSTISKSTAEMSK